MKGLIWSFVLFVFSVMLDRMVKTLKYPELERLFVTLQSELRDYDLNFLVRTSFVFTSIAMVGCEF